MPAYARAMGEVAMLTEALRQTHVYLESRLDLCTDPGVLYARLPGSSLQSIGSIYAHAVVTEDHSLGRRSAKGPLYQSEAWASLGLPEQVWLDPAWAAGFAPPPEQLRAYATEVYTSTESVLAELGDDDLAARTRLHLPEFDGAAVTIKERETSVLFALLDNVVLHMSEHTGEIAALLGVQGLKATPW